MDLGESEWYPLAICHIAIEMVSFQLKMVIFRSYVNVYQRVCENKSSGRENKVKHAKAGETFDIAM